MCVDVSACMCLRFGMAGECAIEWNIHNRLSFASKASRFIHTNYNEQPKDRDVARK